MSFEQISIDPRFLRVLKAQRIMEPTPIQARAIPVALEGRDVVAIAQTGTGKTLAFGLPSLTRLAAKKPERNAMLVLAPTRELAQQVHGVLESLGRPLGLHAACLYGGAGMGTQTDALRRGCAIVVATPGRLLDHMDRGNVRFDRLSILVLDEADRMLDMGFMPDLKRILAKLPKERQTLMFSATFAGDVGRLAADMQHDAVRVEVGPVAKPADAVRQGVYTVESGGKLDLLTTILRKPQVLSTLVFLRTKHRTDRIAKALHREGFKAQAIHGGRTQSQRQQAIDGFRKGRYTVLVATDVAARGLDVQGITHVVNFDIPNSSEDYVHRIGRTARANADGDAITFVSPEDSSALGVIEKALGKALPREEWEGAVHVASRFRAAGERGGDRAGSGAPERRNGSRGNAPRRDGHKSQQSRGSGPRGERSTGNSYRENARRGDAGRTASSRDGAVRGQRDFGNASRNNTYAARPLGAPKGQGGGSEPGRQGKSTARNGHYDMRNGESETRHGRYGAQNAEGTEKRDHAPGKRGNAPSRQRRDVRFR